MMVTISENTYDKNRLNGVEAMQVNIKEYLEECGLKEQLYPGKRLVQRLPQPGENKSHCVVYDWRNPDLLHMEIKAGLSGKDMKAKDLQKFPISFQSPTYLEIATANENAHEEDGDEDDEEGRARGGNGGGGGQKMKKKNPFEAFSDVVEGKIPMLGDVTKLVVMGKEIAKNAMATVLGALSAQIKNMAVAPVNILANVTAVTKIAPGGRPANEIDPSLKEGAKPYKPKDMFGANGP